MNSKWSSIIVIILFMARTTVSAYAVSWQLMVSKKGKYLEEQNGVLFLVLADTAQSELS